jgi:hypothetical protein
VRLHLLGRRCPRPPAASGLLERRARHRGARRGARGPPALPPRLRARGRKPRCGARGRATRSAPVNG